jgi:hypothetical protein
VPIGGNKKQQTVMKGIARREMPMKSIFVRPMRVPGSRPALLLIGFLVIVHNGSAKLGSVFPLSGTAYAVESEEPCYLGGADFAFFPGETEYLRNLSQVWTCPESFRRAWQTAAYLEGIYEAFLYMNGRNPTAWEELATEPYMGVPLGDLWNAYENRPVQVVRQDPPCADEASITPGDIMVGTQPDVGFVVGVGVRLPSPPFEEGAKFCISTGGATNSDRLPFQYYDTYDPNDPVVSVGYFRFDEREWVQSATTEEKKLAALAHLVEAVARDSYHLMKRNPIDWQDLKEAYYWAASLRNPYSGEPIQDVSTLSPSAGDCTYNPNDIIEPYYVPETGRYTLPAREEIIAAAEYTTWPNFVRMFCYNAEREPVSRWKYELVLSRAQNMMAEEDLGEGAIWDYLR